MGKFLSAAQTADALIRKNGTTVTLLKERPGTLDPVTDTDTGTVEGIEFAAVVMAPGNAASMRVGSLEGRNVREVYFAQAGQTERPEPGDTVRIGGDDYRVIYAQTMDPALDGPIMTIAYVER